MYGLILILHYQQCVEKLFSFEQYQCNELKTAQNSSKSKQMEWRYNRIKRKNCTVPSILSTLH